MRHSGRTCPPGSGRKRAQTTQRVQEQVAHALEVAAEKAPAAQSALRERPAVLGVIGAVLGWLFLRSRARRKEDVDGTR